MFINILNRLNSYKEKGNILNETTMSKKGTQVDDYREEYDTACPDFISGNCTNLPLSGGLTATSNLL
ncbi:MAG: hypothetical protein A2046_14265 [Bacteroidetes bacterium GWA2_30_7]|nr:MAG: hypothetical protein A2046_14265 [Bacteroidetes bacterium GWA2_30_7]